ncbi:MAG: dihydropteroate synthase [Acidimicrobiales bacterium]
MEDMPWRVVYEVPCPEVALGPHRFDTRHRALVMGILNRTPDSFLTKAEQLVDGGADCLDVRGVRAGPGPEITEAEELDRVIPAIEAVHARFDVPISVDTSRASVLRESIAAGAVVGRDISGFADDEYLPAAAAAGASVVATHVDDEPVVDAVCRFLRDRAERAEAAGIPRERVLVDAGLDLCKTEPASLELLRAHDQLADLGWPLFLSASSHAAIALGIALGSRILRAHDVRGARRTADVMAAVLEARSERAAV